MTTLIWGKWSFNTWTTSAHPPNPQSVKYNLDTQRLGDGCNGEGTGSLAVQSVRDADVSLIGIGFPVATKFDD